MKQSTFSKKSLMLHQMLSPFSESSEGFCKRNNMSASPVKAVSPLPQQPCYFPWHHGRTSSCFCAEVEMVAQKIFMWKWLLPTLINPHFFKSRILSYSFWVEVWIARSCMWSLWCSDRTFWWSSRRAFHSWLHLVGGWCAWKAVQSKMNIFVLEGVHFQIIFLARV